MADPYGATRLYYSQFDTAKKLFESGQYEECIAEAKKNLTDPTLPQYYVIKTCILLTSAEDDWDQADVWRLTAEHSYRKCFEANQERPDKDTAEALVILRKELDQLAQFKAEDLQDMAYNMDDSEDLDLEAELQEAEDVARAENEVEIAADSLRLPIRETTDIPTTPYTHFEAAVEAPIEEPPPTVVQAGTLRKQRSRMLLPVEIKAGQRRVTKKSSFYRKKE